MKLTGDLSLMRDHFPCKFHQDWTKHSGSYLWGISSRCHLAHLLVHALLHWGWWEGLAICRRDGPWWVAGPLWVLSRLDQVFRGSWAQGCLSRALPRMVPHPWPAAPDIIWHIYSGQCCFKGEQGMDLPSSGEVTLTIGQVPCEFSVDWTRFIIRENWDNGPSSPAPPGLWGWCTKGSSRCDLAHLLRQGCFKGGWRYEPAIFSWGCAHHRAGPCEFWDDWPWVIFQEKLRQGAEQPSSPRFVRVVHRGQLQMWFSTFTWGSTASRGRVVSTCHFQVTPPHHLVQVQHEFWADWTRLIFQGKLRQGA